MVLQVTQKILAPANETLQEGCLPASQSQFVPPSLGLTLLRPSSGADQAPAHFKDVQRLFPLVDHFSLPLSTFEFFPQSPSPSLHAESGSPVVLTWHPVHVMFHIFFINGYIEHLSFSLDYQLLDGRPRICLFTVCPQCPARNRSSVNVWIEVTT